MVIITRKFIAPKITIAPPEPIEYHYYGVKISKSNADPKSSIEYIDDAVGMTSRYNSWKELPIISGIKPCLLKDGTVECYLNPDDFTKSTDGSPVAIDDITAGDVMIEVPKIGYKMESDDEYQYIWVTDNPKADGYCYYAHSLDSENDCDKIYIGAYLGHSENEKIYSVSGKTPVVNTAPQNLRTYAESKGTGYQLFSFYPLTLMQCLYTIIYKNLDSQSALGQGFVAKSNTEKAITGGTNQKGMCYGESTGTEQMKFLGLEDFWGNCYELVDGARTDADGNILTDYNNFSESTYKYSYSYGTTYLVNYIKEVLGTNISGFVVKTGGGGASNIKHYCDYGIITANSNMRHGGFWNYGINSYSGIYLTYFNLSETTKANDLSCRLLYKHKSK